METGAMKCHNCHAMNHRSSNCPWPPNHRRCYKCGKAGGKFQHREGCEDAWYDLSILPPRNYKGELYPREIALQLLLDQYHVEKAKVTEARRRVANSAADRPQNRRGRGMNTEFTNLRSFVRNLKDMNVPRGVPMVGNRPPFSPRVEAVSANVKSEKASSTLKIAQSAPSTSIAVGIEQHRSSTRIIGMVQDVRVTDGVMTPDGKPIPQKTPGERVLLADCEKIYYQRSKSGFGIRLNEVDAHPTAEMPPLLMRMVFRHNPRLFIDYGTSSQFELGGTVLRMTNGLRVRYNGTFLDLCGQPSGDVVLEIVAEKFKFRLVIHEDSVEINETYFLGDLGMACLSMPQNMLPTPPSSVVNIVGPDQDEIRIRYKNNRYSMTFLNGIAMINPFIQRTN